MSARAFLCLPKSAMNCCFDLYFNLFERFIFGFWLFFAVCFVLCVFGFLEKGMMYWGSC